MQKVILFFLLLVSTVSLQAQSESIGLSFPDLKAEAGADLCVPLNVYQFRNMLSMQYTISFDAEKLQFAGLKDYKLPYMNQSNFGLYKVAEGKLTVVWIDNALKGVTVMDGEPVVNVCFKVLGDAGEETEINFAEDPTPFEAVNLAEQIVKINTKKGKIRIQ